MLEQAVENQRAALQANPRSVVCLMFLRNHYQNLTLLYKKMPQFAEDEKASHANLAALEKLIADRPNVPPGQFETRVKAFLAESARQSRTKDR